MTPEQAIKHKEVIKWFLDNPEKGVWCKQSFGTADIYGYRIVKDPDFNSEIYLQNDEYTTLRKRLANGEEIIYRFGILAEDGSDRWVDLNVSPTSNNIGTDFYDFEWKLKQEEGLIEVAPGEYKIIDKKFSEHDWVITTDNEIVKLNGVHRTVELLPVPFGYKQYIEKNSEVTLTTIFEKDIKEKWIPKEDETCVFYGDNSKSFRVSKFQCIAHGKGKEGKFKDQQGNYFKYCEPYVGQQIEELNYI